MPGRTSLTLSQVPALPFAAVTLAGAALALLTTVDRNLLIGGAALFFLVSIAALFRGRWGSYGLPIVLVCIFFLAWFRGSLHLERDVRWAVHELAEAEDETRVIGRVRVAARDSWNGGHVVLDRVLLEGAAASISTGDLRVRFFADSAALAGLRYGDLVAGAGRLRSGAERSGRFTGALYGLVTRRETADLFAESETVVSSAIDGHVIRRGVDAFRYWIIDTFNQGLNSDAAALCNALILGDRREFGYRFNEQLRMTGLSHIFALSGLNTGLIVSMLWVVLGLLFVPRTARYWLLLAATLFYMELGREVPSLVRASLMCSMFLVGRILQRRGHVLNYVTLALFIELLWRPMDLVDPGFALSYLAVLGIVGGYHAVRLGMITLIGDDRAGFRRSVTDLMAGTITAQIGTLPLVAFLFQRIPLLGVLGNLLVVPGFAILLILASLFLLLSAISPFLADVLGAGIEALAGLLAIIVVFFASLPWSGIPMPGSSLPWTMLIYAGIGITLFELARLRWFRATVWGLALCTVLIWNGIFSGDSSSARLSFIDIGNGDAILIETEDQHCVLIDAGAKYGDWSAARIIYPYLSDRGIAALDGLILTHPDNDHIGGAAELLQRIPVGNLWVNGDSSESRAYIEMCLAVEANRLNPSELRSGDVIEIGYKTQLVVLSPDSLVMASDDSENNKGIVMRLDAGESSALLTADIDSVREYDLFNWNTLLDVDLLRAGHHGSRSSSGGSFLERCSPEICVITAGRRNPYDHPAQEVLDRMEELHISYLITGEESTLVFEARGSGWERVETPAQRLAELWGLP